MEIKALTGDEPRSNSRDEEIRRLTGLGSEYNRLIVADPRNYTLVGAVRAALRGQIRMVKAIKKLPDTATERQVVTAEYRAIRR